MKVISIPLILAISIITGCQSYKPLAFIPKDLLRDVTAERLHAKHLRGTAFTFADAARQMSANSPDLKELKADYERLKAVSDIPTPWSNPELEAGVAGGRRLADVVASKTQPFVSLGFAIPLGPRLSREDDLNAIRTANARAGMAASHRVLYLDLRSTYIKYAIANETLRARDQVIETVTLTRNAAIKLEDAGTIGKIELTQISLETQLEAIERTNDKLAVDTVNGQLANLLGVSGSRIPPNATTTLPTFPKALPTLNQLKLRMIEHSIELNAIAREFKEHDARLRLELSKQYPDVTIGGGFEQEVGEKAQIFDLSIGLELPLFDLNRQGIAEAVEQRKGSLTSYKAELSRKLTTLDVLSNRYAIQLNQLNLLKNSIIPKSTILLTYAARAIDSGSWNFMRFLDMQRTHRELIMRQLAQKRMVWATLIELEKAVGYPLALFEGEDALIPQPLKTSKKQSSED